MGVIEAAVIVVSFVETDSDVVPADIIVESGVVVLNGVTKREFKRKCTSQISDTSNEPKILISGKKISSSYF